MIWKIVWHGDFDWGHGTDFKGLHGPRTDSVRVSQSETTKTKKKRF